MKLINTLLLSCILLPVLCPEHEVRPAYLKISELKNGELEFRWRQPIKGE